MINALSDYQLPANEDTAAPPVRAKLKWFNGPKGFGFVVPTDRDVDAFLHVTTLQRAGVSTLGEGADILCCITYGPKGAMVTEVTEIINHGILPVSDMSLFKRPNMEGRQRPSLHEDGAFPLRGTVKWYRADKGFGFIVPEDKGKDVFVHKACLDQAGIICLETGQTVSMTVRDVQKGREAVTLYITDTR